MIYIIKEEISFVYIYIHHELWIHIISLDTASFSFQNTQFLKIPRIFLPLPSQVHY